MYRDKIQHNILDYTIRNYIVLLYCITLSGTRQNSPTGTGTTVTTIQRRSATLDDISTKPIKGRIVPAETN